LGWYLEEIYVTWAHLEKKRTRLRLYTKSFEEIMHTKRGDDVADFKRRRHDFQSNDVMDLMTASGHSRLKVALEDSTWRRHENPMRTLEDYSKPSYEVYRNTIELPKGNNVVSLQSDTIRWVQKDAHSTDFAHLASTQPSQVNKITTSCEICSGPHDTQYSMEDPEQAFVEYASLRTDEARGLVSEFMASQDARLSKFEADFKQEKSEMTNKIETVLKAITDRIVGTLPSDMIKNLKIGTHPVSSARSYPTQPEIKTKAPQPEEPKPTLEDEFQDLHLNLSNLEVLAHALIYNAILDKYDLTIPIRSYDYDLVKPKMILSKISILTTLVLSTPDRRVIEFKNQVRHLMEAHIAPKQSVQVNKISSLCEICSGPHDTQYCMENPEQAFVDYASSRTDKAEGKDSKPFDTLANLGSCVNVIPLYLFKKLNIGLFEETDHVFRLADGTKSYPVGIDRDVEVHIGRLKLLNDFYVIDMKKDPETPLLLGRGFLATVSAVID
nr:MAK10-like protein [Tanacetum cinerariifolium]